MKTKQRYTAPDCEYLFADLSTVLCQSPTKLDDIIENPGNIEWDSPVSPIGFDL